MLRMCPHLFNLCFNATGHLEAPECLGADGNKQLTNSLVDPHPVFLLVLCIAEVFRNHRSNGHIHILLSHLVTLCEAF